MFGWFKRKKIDEDLLFNNKKVDEIIDKAFESTTSIDEDVSNIPILKKRIKFTLNIIYYEKYIEQGGCSYSLIADNKFGIRFALMFDKWFKTATPDSFYTFNTKTDYLTFVRKDIKRVYITWEEIYE